MTRYFKYKDSYIKYRQKKGGLISKKCKENYRFGNDCDIIISKLGGVCGICGMTNKEHILESGRRLVVHHKDGQGRNKKMPNNNLSNLDILCMSCHAKKHNLGNKARRKMVVKK